MPSRYKRSDTGYGTYDGRAARQAGYIIKTCNYADGGCTGCKTTTGTQADTYIHICASGQHPVFHGGTS